MTPLRGGMGEVGTHSGYPSANDDEDYRWTKDTGWGDHRRDYGNPHAPGAGAPMSTAGYGGSRACGEFEGRGPRGYGRSDARIHEDVCDRIATHPALNARDIAVIVTNGEVVLQGIAPDRANKRLADDVAASVGGVAVVHNQLRVARISYDQDADAARR
jgi:hypothetical protein